jgi:formate dehydrogenase beta subunit
MTVFCSWENTAGGKPVTLARGQERVAAVIAWGDIAISDPEVDVVALCHAYSLAVRDNSCGQCIPCRVGTGVIAELFGKIAGGCGTPQDLEQIRLLSQVVSKASFCEIGQDSPKAFIELLDRFNDAFEDALAGRQQARNVYTYRSMVTAPCIEACPMHLDIPRYIENIRLGKFAESLAVIKEKLPLPGSVGRVCVRPCEAGCRRGKVDQPLQIKHLKRFVADYALENAPQALPAQGEISACLPDAGKHPDQRTKVAIVGAGPAGLTCAYFLAQRGYAVTIYEILPEPGGMAAVGIPDYRLPRNILAGEVEAIRKLGVTILYGKCLGVDFTLDQLESEGFKAIFIGMGCHCHKHMNIEGENKGYYGHIPGVLFLRNVNLGLLSELPKGRKMVVVGGGNVAIDCVRTAFRLGFAEASIVYRRSKTEMPADPVEITDAEDEGVSFNFLVAPTRIVAEHGRVTGLECIRMELSEPDESGRKRPMAIPGSEFIIDADVIVPAIGQDGDYSCLCNLPGVEITAKGAIIVDQNLQTVRNGVFAGGDCITGPASLIQACAHGRLAGLKIDTFLTEGRLEQLSEELDQSFLKQLQACKPSETISLPGGTERMPIRHEPPPARKSDFREADKGYAAEEAVAEAGRCLRCYRVVTCAFREK